MTMLRWIRLVGLAATGGLLASMVVLWSGVSTAGATSRDGLCTLLPALCPPTTKTTPTTKAPVTTAPPTTKAPATTPPATTKPATGTTAAATQRSTTANRSGPAVASVGAAGLSAPAMAPSDMPALGADAAAPELAVTAAPTTTVFTRVPPALSGLVGTTTAGLPNDHKSLRVALSILVLLVAAVAAAQLPPSRRSPRPAGDPPD
jgi:hypothetical protein